MTSESSVLPEGHASAFHQHGQEAQKTYSQLGEDLAIIHYVRHKRGGRYVDVGCHHPFRFSNTALLHLEFGWSGINIDADQRAVDAFRQYRPRDTNLYNAVGMMDQEIEIAIFKEGAVNSVLPAVWEANRHAWGQPTMQSVRMRPLADILNEHLKLGDGIDFLNVDVEGLDLSVLKSMDWAKYQPTVIAVEIHDLDLRKPHGSETVEYLGTLDYHLKSFSVATAIFTR